MTIAYPRGSYSFLKGLGPYSAGVAAAPGYEIEHVRFRRARQLREGFEWIEAHLNRLSRPRQALCGLELRAPRPYTFEGFAQFNQGYIDILKSWEIFLDELNPVARTNVAPEVNPPDVSVIHGFSYTIPARHDGNTFVVAGAGELSEGSLDARDVVRRGETSPDALAAKIDHVLGLMNGRLAQMGLAWSEVSVTDVYTVHDVHPFLARKILSKLGPAQLQGLTWFYARPPVESIEYEMDLRSCRSELVL